MGGLRFYASIDGEQLICISDGLNLFNLSLKFYKGRCDSDKSHSSNKVALSSDFSVFTIGCAGMYNNSIEEAYKGLSYFFRQATIKQEL